MRAVLEEVAGPLAIVENLNPRDVAVELRRTPIVVSRKTTTGARAGIESSARAPCCYGLTNISCPLTKQIELCSRGEIPVLL